MAKGTDHIAIGIGIALCGVYFFWSPMVTSLDLSIWFIACIAGSLFPDIDVKSKGQKFFYCIMAPFYLFFFAQGNLILCFFVGLTALIPILCNHRGLFHSLWFIALFTGLWSMAILQWLPSYENQVVMATIFFLCGALSHLLLDFGFKNMIFH